MTEHTTTAELQMNAYYYSFHRTGTLAVDRVLSAVAVAGKGCHHTADWGQYGHVDKIQEAAALAAAEFKALIEALYNLVELANPFMTDDTQTLAMEQARAALYQASVEVLGGGV